MQFDDNLVDNFVALYLNKEHNIIRLLFLRKRLLFLIK